MNNGLEEYLKNKNKFNRKICIYQIKDIAKTSYSFRDYNEAEFNINDYNKVITETYQTKYNDSRILDIYLTIGNTSELQKRYPDKKIRSLSVSDIIQIDDTYYYIQSFGYKKILVKE